MLESFQSEMADRGLSRHTIRAYVGFLRRADDALQAVGKSLTTATVCDFADLIRELSKAGLKASSIDVAVRAFRGWMRFCGKANWDALEGPKLDGQRIRDVFQEDQMGDVLEAAGRPVLRRGGIAPNKPARDKAIMAVLYASGCRVDELVHLQIEDIIWAQERIRFKRIKGGATHVGYLTESAIRILAEYLRTLPQPLNKAGWIFPSSAVPGRPLGTDAVRRLFVHIGKLLKLTWKPTPHTMRRTMITHHMKRLSLADDKAPIATVAEMVGHKRWATTARYTCYDKTHLIAEYNKRAPWQRVARGEPANYFPDTPARPTLDPTTFGLSFQ